MNFYDLIQNFHHHLMDPARIPLAMIAIVVVLFGGMLRGGLGGNAMPFFWHLVEIFFGSLGKKMNNISRPAGDLIFRGFLLAVLVMVVSFLIGKGLEKLSTHMPELRAYAIFEIIAVCLCLTSGAVMAAQGRLYRALNEKKVTQGAYFMLARSSRTNFTKCDDFTITRIGMGMGIRAFDKGLVAPVFWYLLFGLSGAYLYAGLAALQWLFGMDGHSRGFGKAMNAIEELLGFVPNLLSGFLIAAAGILTPTAGMTRAFLGLAKVKGKAPYAEGGLPVTAAAYALNVSLGGATVDLDGNPIKRIWVGPAGATAQLGAKHLHRAVYIVFMAHLLFLATLSGAMVFANDVVSFDFLTNIFSFLSK